MASASWTIFTFSGVTSPMIRIPSPGPGNTIDFMTAEAAELPWEVIGSVSNRIVNEVQHVNRVLYDCTGKPPATIEFE